jgi:hypothetical protein
MTSTPSLWLLLLLNHHPFWIVSPFWPSSFGQSLLQVVCELARPLWSIIINVNIIHHCHHHHHHSFLPLLLLLLLPLIVFFFFFFLASLSFFLSPLNSFHSIAAVIWCSATDRPHLIGTHHITHHTRTHTHTSHTHTRTHTHDTARGVLAGQS